MSKNAIIILLILIVPLAAYFMLSKTKTNNFVEAKVNAPQMIKFTSRMCYDCQRLETIVKEVLPSYSGKVTLTEVFVQDNSYSVQNLIKKYQVKLVPTSIFIDKDGIIKDKVEGFMDKQTLENYLNEIANNG